MSSGGVYCEDFGKNSLHCTVYSTHILSLLLPADASALLFQVPALYQCGFQILSPLYPYKDIIRNSAGDKVTHIFFQISLLSNDSMSPFMDKMTYFKMVNEILSRPMTFTCEIAFILIWYVVIKCQPWFSSLDNNISGKVNLCLPS